VLYGFVPLETGIARDSLFLGLSRRCRESGFRSWKFWSFQNVKGVLQVEKENILEGKIDSLMRRLEKMEIEKKEAQDIKAAEAKSNVKSAENMALSTRIVRRKPRCSTT
jgi:hypothetical protein